MSAFVAFLSAVGVVAVLVWRISRAVRAALYLQRATKQTFAWWRKENPGVKTYKNGLLSISSPQEAALVLMLLTARAGGEIGQQQKDVIINQLTGRFEIPMAEAEILLADISSLCEGLPDAEKALVQMSEFIHNKVSTRDLIELEDMLMKIAHANGEPSLEQRQALNKYTHLVGI